MTNQGPYLQSPHLTYTCANNQCDDTLTLDFLKSADTHFLSFIINCNNFININKYLNYFSREKYKSILKFYSIVKNINK